MKGKLSVLLLREIIITEKQTDRLTDIIIDEKLVF